MGRLKNAVSDAKAFKDALSSLGFQVSVKFNLAKGEMLDHLSAVLEDWRYNASEIIFYYSGHGVSVGAVFFFTALDFRGSLSNFIFA